MLLIESFSLSLVYSAIKDVAKYILGRRRRLTPEEKLELRQKWKSLFEDWIWKNHVQGLRDDVIIRDVSRLESYPDVDQNNKTQKISPWFRVGLMGIYHKGIMVGLRWGELISVNEEGAYRFPNYAEDEAGDLRVIKIGYVPFENIVNVDSDGDEYDSFPHIFCHFDACKNEPYEKLSFCVEKQNPGGRRFYMEIGDYDEIYRLSKIDGINDFG